MIEPNRVWKLEEFSKKLRWDYSRFFCVKKLPKISIIFYESLPNSVFLWAINRSEDVIGCTGDDSFSRVISMGKIPMYHALGHKKELKASFVNFMAKQNLPQLTRIISNFPDQDNALNEEFRYKNILKSIDRGKLMEEMQEFKSKTIEIIKRDYSLLITFSKHFMVEREISVHLLRSKLLFLMTLKRLLLSIIGMTLEKFLWQRFS